MSQAALDAALVVNDREALTLAYLAMSRAAFEDGDYALYLTLAIKSREFARSLEPAMGQAPLFLHAPATRMKVNMIKQRPCLRRALILIGRSAT